MRKRGTRNAERGTDAPASRAETTWGSQACIAVPRSAFGMIPASYQPPLPLDRLLLPVGAPGAGDRMELDVVIVGAGPAGLACAITLAQLAQQSGGPTQPNHGGLRKAGALGGHSPSGG